MTNENKAKDEMSGASTQRVSHLVRKYFSAYQSRNREGLEKLLADDFTFSSPLDDRIDKAQYFERCWPNSEHQQAFHIEKLCEQSNEAFVTYACKRTDGGTLRNTEFFTIEGGKIKHVDVYFGSEDKKSAEEAEITSLIEDTAEACRAKDVSALTVHYASDVLAFDVVNPLQSIGSAEVGERAAQWFSSWQGPIDYEMRDLTIAAGDDTAFAHSLNHVNGTKTDGQKVDMWWRATVCCRRLDGKWMITHLHSSVPFDMETGKASLEIEP